MKFTERTKNILANFVNIYSGLEFKQGNVIKTMGASKEIRVTANVTETIPQDFAVYDLSKFLNTLSLFKEPEIDFHEKYCTISSGKSKVKYYFADPRLVRQQEDRENLEKNVKLPSVDVELELTSEHLSSVFKAAKTLGLKEIAFVGDGETLSIAALDASGSISDEFSVDIGETDKTFKAVFKDENLKMIADTYQVKICSRGIASFQSNDLLYYVLMESRASEFK